LDEAQKMEIMLGGEWQKGEGMDGLMEKREKMIQQKGGMED
jgi:hypothetical protein